MPEPRSMDPPYRRVAAWLRSEIASGHLKPGEQVPSASELATQFSVSKNTALRALALLKDEGLILTQQGWGSFVAGDPAG